MPDPSPSQELRQAAQMMREQHGPGHVRHVFWSALAGWLDVEAGILEKGLPDPTGGWAEARAVARAYLGTAETEPAATKRASGEQV